MKTKMEITNEQILELAKIDHNTNRKLREMFPEAFDKSVDVSYDMLVPRLAGEYENKAFYLNDLYNWELKRDSKCYLCLIPTLK